jgi:spore cortex biosynthesis protein YabQ
MGSQAWLFLSTVLAGAAIGFFYDAFRIFRITAPRFAKNALVVQLEDLFFWAAVTAGMFYFMLNQNYGEIRLFAIIGAIIGIALYFAALSRFVILIFVSIINYIKKVFFTAIKILLTPLRLLKNLLIPLAKKIRSGLCRLMRYGKIRIKKSARNWFILRKKV